LRGGFVWSNTPKLSHSSQSTCLQRRTAAVVVVAKQGGVVAAVAMAVHGVNGCSCAKGPLAAAQETVLVCVHTVPQHSEPWCMVAAPILYAVPELQAFGGLHGNQPISAVWTINPSAFAFHHKACCCVLTCFAIRCLSSNPCCCSPWSHLFVMAPGHTCCDGPWSHFEACSITPCALYAVRKQAGTP